MNSNNWGGNVEFKKIFVETGQYKADGSPKLRPITLRKIILTNGDSKLECSVTKTQHGWKIRDPREEWVSDGRDWVNGECVTKLKQTCKGESLLPGEWIRRMGRLIGEEKAHSLLVEATFGIKPSAD